MTPNTHDFMQTANAQVWAQEFIKRAKGDPAFALDEGNMIGWFANAIMRGHDDGFAKGQNSTPTRAATDATFGQGDTLNERVHDMLLIAANRLTHHSRGVECDCPDIIPVAKALAKEVKAHALSSSPSSTTATPNALHPADEAMLQSYATRQIGEGMPGMVQDASKLARYAIILRMQLSRALPSSRALSEEEQSALVQAFIAFDRSSTTRPLATIIGEIVTRERGGFCGSPESDTCTCASQLGFRACLSAGAPK
jgi:hypothetical protein